MVFLIRVFHATRPCSLLSNSSYFYKVNLTLMGHTAFDVNSQKYGKCFFSILKGDMLVYFNCTRLMCIVTFYYLYLALLPPLPSPSPTYQLTNTGLEYQSKTAICCHYFSWKSQKNNRWLQFMSSLYALVLQRFTKKILCFSPAQSVWDHLQPLFSALSCLFSCKLSCYI